MTTRSSPPRRGRSVLLWAVGLFIGVQLTASVLLDYRWPGVRFPRFYAQVERIDTLAAPPNIVFLGSSRTLALADEAEATRAVRALTGDPAAACFNAAVPAGDPIVAERMLRLLLKHGVQPRFIVIELCPEGVNQRNGWLSLYVEWLLRWDDLPRYFKDLADTDCLVRYTGTRLIPLYVYRDQIRRRLGEQVHTWWTRKPAEPPAGREPAPTEVAVDVRAAVAADHRALPTAANPAAAIGLDSVPRTIRDYRPGGNAAAALERILALCRRRGIEPILVTVPLTAGHRDFYTSPMQAVFAAYVADMTRRYGCRYYDYRAALPDGCFIDHHHASAAWSALFSRQLSLEVLAPAWNARQRQRR